jgi:hypothetical protein
MPVATITYRLSRTGQKDSLRKNGDGCREQVATGEVPLDLLDAFVIDADGNVSFDATRAPKQAKDEKYKMVVTVARFGRKGYDVEWDVYPTWDDLLSYVRWADSVEKELDEATYADYLADERARVEAGHAFMTDPAARPDRVEEDSVRIGGWSFWESDIVAEAKRRWAADQADQEEKRQANRRTLAAWIADHGSENQRQRLAAGLLPWREAHAAMEGFLFAPLQEFPLYERFDPADVCICERAGQEACKPKFESVDATELTAEEWDRLSAIQAVVPDGQFQLREHRARCKSRVEPLMRRGVIVKRTVGSLTFKREFAL